MRRSRIACFLLTGIIIMSILPSAFAAEAQVITKTDWTVTGGEDIQNQTVRVKGVLTIKAGGRLSLHNTSLLMDEGAGIVAEKGSLFQVSGSKIKSNRPGSVYYTITIGCDDAIIQNSEIAGLGNGKDKYGSSLTVSGKNATIQSSTIDGSIKLINSQGSKIIDNKLSVDKDSPAPYYAIRLENSHQVNLARNTIYGFGCGIYCSYSWNNIMDSNVWYAQREQLINRAVEKWWALDITEGYIGIAGIWLDNMSNNNMATNNIFYGSACTGFRITQSTNNTFEKNITKGTRVGGVVNFASNNILNANAFYDIWEYEAVEVYRAYNNYIINNYINAATVGIGLIGSKDNTVSGNRIENSGKAFFLFNAVNNKVYKNSAVKNIISITIDNSSGNAVSANNFIDNKEQAYTCDGNDWGDNYWKGVTSSLDAKLDTNTALKANDIKSLSPPVIAPARFADRNQKIIMIDKAEVWENKTVELDGQIIINATGSLTLNNVTLLFKPGSYTAYEFSIMANGGILNINHCKIIGLEYDKVCSIVARDSKSFVMKDSTVSYLGNWEGGSGLTTENIENVVIENNTFTGCYAAGRIDKVKNLVYTGNTVDNCYIGMSIVGISGSVQVNGNKINRSAYHGLKLFASQGKAPSPAIVSGNTISNSWGDGIYDTGIEKMGVIVRDNRYADLKGPGRITVSGLNIDTRAVRPLTAYPLSSNKGDTMKTYVIFTGLNNYDNSRSFDLDVKLTRPGLADHTEKLLLKPGEQGYITFITKVQNDGLFDIVTGGQNHNESGPDKQETAGSKKPSVNAKRSGVTVLVNGKEVGFDAFAINGNNYFKLRDLAMALNGSNKQFEVTWDSKANAINLKSKNKYTPVGGELAAAFESAEAEAVMTESKVFLDGREIPLTAYSISGNNYFKLRDIGKALDFGVTWDGAASTIGIDTASSYADEGMIGEKASGNHDNKSAIASLHTYLIRLCGEGTFL